MHRPAMPHRAGHFALATVAAIVCLLEPPAGAAPAPQPSAPPPAPRPHRATDPIAMEAFEQHVQDYLKLHRGVESKLPKLSKSASPQEIDKHERLLAEQLRQARPDARQREFFTPAVQNVLEAAFEDVFRGSDGRALLASIMDENPKGAKLTVNGRYPDEVPLSTMPAEVLSVLPKLEEDMEYRIVGDRLILLDAHAHIVVDFTDPILPKQG